MKEKKHLKVYSTNKASCGFDIELDEDEEFDPQKAYVVCRDFIYPNETDEPILVAFVYDGVAYTDICPETSKEYWEEQIWPTCVDNDDWSGYDEVDEDEVDEDEE